MPGTLASPRGHRYVRAVLALGKAAFTYSWTLSACSAALTYQLFRRDREALVRHQLGWAEVLRRGWGITLEVEGNEHLDLTQPTLLISNHQSYCDIVALFRGLPAAPVFLAKKELHAVPLFGKVMETGGHIFIDRQKHAKAVETMKSAASQLRPHHPLVVFPEGTRAPIAEIMPFKKGAFHLAKAGKARVHAVGISGSLERWPADHVGPNAGTIHMRIGPELGDLVARLDVDELTDAVRRDVGRLAGLPLGEWPASSKQAKQLARTTPSV